MTMNREMDLKDRQKTFRAAGIVIFCTALGLLLSRILLRYIMKVFPVMDDASEDIVSDVIFDIMAQIITLLVVPFLIYKFYLKKSTRDILYMSNVRKTDPRIYPLSVLLGICAFVITIYVSFMWQLILANLGYDGSSSYPMPEKFHLWHLLLMLFLTAVLPAVCEEFTNRGIFLSAMRGSFSKWQTVIIGGITFGLFHQYISQVFYTALMGMLLTYLVLTTRSIIPAAIVHFTNNAISVAVDFMSEYAAIDPISYGVSLLTDSPGLLLLFLIMAVALAALTLMLIKKCYGSYYTKNYAEFLKTGNVDCYEKTVCYWTMADVRYKPTLRDWTFYIGAAVLTAVYTGFTFYWGFF